MQCIHHTEVIYISTCHTVRVVRADLEWRNVSNTNSRNVNTTDGGRVTFRDMGSKGVDDVAHPNEYSYFGA